MDTTLFFDNDLVWLFTNVVRKGGEAATELYLYVAETPLGPWRPHPQNPIVRDIGTARPAGNLFVEDGRLTRPGQDCAARFGHGITLNHIEVLTENDYAETFHTRIGAEHWRSDAICTHTLNRTRRFEVTDMIIRREMPE